MTIAQSIGTDGHFIIEQGARAWSGLYMNFNGTAGIWRKEAIVDAGNWQVRYSCGGLGPVVSGTIKGMEYKISFSCGNPIGVANGRKCL